MRASAITKDGLTPKVKENDLPMTLLVALKATNGWLLASDTLLREIDPATSAPYLSNVRKIEIPLNVPLVYAYSGDDLSRTAGLLLRNELRANGCPAESRETLLMQVGNSLLSDRAPRPISMRRLIVVFTAPPIEIWTLDLFTPPHPFCWTPIRRAEHVTAGAPTGATLFPQLFYSPLPIEKLQMLAAHTILTGAQCEPSLISGLDIYVAPNHGPSRFLSPDEIRELIHRSENLQSSIRQTLSG